MDFSKLDSGLSTSLCCVPGEWKITESDFVAESQVKPGMTMEDLLNAAIPAQKKPISASARFEIPKVEHLTPELKLELAAIRLRRFAYKDKFMKSSDSKDIPSRFQIGTVVGGGLQAVGGGRESQAAGTWNRKQKKGKSHLMNLLHDDTVKDWLHKNIIKRANVARPKSKHPKVKRAS
jgi:hypothetical protein